MGLLVTRAVATVCGLAMLQGCSWASVEGPPPDHAARTHFTCTTSRAVPVLDTVVAVPLVLGGGALILDDSGGHGYDGLATALGVILLIPGALLGASAVSGFTDTAACHDALDALTERQRLAARTAPTASAPSVAVPQSQPPVSVPLAPPGSTVPSEPPVLLFAEPPSTAPAPSTPAPSPIEVTP